MLASRMADCSVSTVSGGPGPASGRSFLVANGFTHVHFRTDSRLRHVAEARHLREGRVWQQAARGTWNSPWNSM